MVLRLLFLLCLCSYQSTLAQNSEEEPPIEFRKQDMAPSPVYNYALFNRAMKYYTNRRYKKAFRLFDRYVHQFPDDEDGYLYRAKSRDQMTEGTGCEDFKMAAMLGSAEAARLVQECK